MTKSEYKMVLAWTHAQALHYAKHMGWSRSEWRLVRDDRDLKGVYNVILFDLRAPRYQPNHAETLRMDRIRNEVAISEQAGRIIRINVVNLDKLK